ncbi:hypothetical protein ABZX93_33475 [Streptomyces sp. NPDC006632]|uniref:hypothetical protein n=1 Tax=Streptomyces sp. NPDC006632 TaxID=3157182 RepID=UPI00339DFF5A
MKRAMFAAATAAAVLVIAGCSSQTEQKPEQSKGTGSTDTAAGTVAFAQAYQTALNGQDWQRVCQMRTERYRKGTVETCVAKLAAKDAPVASSESESSEPPLRRADGSIIPPKQTPSHAGPERPQFGKVTASGWVTVPAIGDHPAGAGVRVEYTETWPDNTSTTRLALRVITQGGQRLVDQSVDIFTSDETHGNPVHDALMRG